MMSASSKITMKVTVIGKIAMASIESIFVRATVTMYNNDT